MCLGLPSKLDTREELSTLLSVAIFTGTVQHAATNNGQVSVGHTPWFPVWSAGVLWFCSYLCFQSSIGVPGFQTPPAQWGNPRQQRRTPLLWTPSWLPFLISANPVCRWPSHGTWEEHNRMPLVYLCLSVCPSIRPVFTVDISLFHYLGSVGPLQRGVLHRDQDPPADWQV